MTKPKLPIDPAQPLGRAQAESLAVWILSNHLSAQTSGKAGLDLGPTAAAFDPKAAGLEGLSRLLWAAVPLLAGNCALSEADISSLFEGLANGTNPDHADYLGLPGNMDQRLVEMAGIAMLIREVPDIVSKHMDEQAKQHLFTWLSSIQTVRINPSNWRFFRILVLDALASQGWSIDRAVLEEELAFIDSQYVGDGWYQDNANARRFDLYNPFAFHFYGLLYARWHRTDDAERAERFIERARVFAHSYQHWFAEDGASIAYGRSLTYRFAVAGFWGMLAEVGHPDMDAGVLRGLWARSVRWWLGQKIWDADGYLTVGYAYPDLLISEFYNSAQSPLWALKAFAPLNLPEDHPFWTAEEKPLPRRGNRCHHVTATKQLMWNQNGVAYLACPPPPFKEIRYTSDKYAKLAYSSHHGFCVQSLDWISCGFAGDNMLALSRDKETWAFRDTVEQVWFEDGRLVSIWSPFAGCRVTCHQDINEINGQELRSFTIETDTPLHVLATGHAADVFVPPRALEDVLASDALPETAPALRGEALMSDLHDLNGKLARRVLPCAPNSNLMHPQAAVPALMGEIPVGQTILRTRLIGGRHS